MRFFFYLFALFTLSAHAQNPRFSNLTASTEAVDNDLRLILQKANLSPDSLSFQWFKAKENKIENRISVTCTQSPLQLHLQIHADSTEWASTFYYGLQKIGFLFPHPRIQISPSLAALESACGQKWIWKPRLQYRGFHLHMQHPNEWVHGFLMGQPQIAVDVIRWLARNQQNTMDLMLVRQDLAVLQKHLTAPFQLAHKMGIHFGVNISFVEIQQKCFHLGNPLIGILSTETRILSSLDQFSKYVPFDFLTMDIGSSEFTSSNFTDTLSWINGANAVLRHQQKQLFIKAHVSFNQFSPIYGNFNYLAQYSTHDVGVLPHSVMFFSLLDPLTPVYGRKDLSDMRIFLLQQNLVRPTWYFPETSYFIGMDIDVPLLLTDYLLARSEDMDFLQEQKIHGQINFTTGQELGYWLFDWTVALLANSEYQHQPLIALKLLGEDLPTWKNITEFQDKYFKKENLLAILSSSSLLDELPYLQPVYERVILRKLKNNLSLLSPQLHLLEQAMHDRPALDLVKNKELRLLLQVTWDRIEHAYWIRKALQQPIGSLGRANALDQAKNIRLQALVCMATVVTEFNRYPEAKTFELQSNPTSYQFGYGWPAATLHFWEREEEMVRKDDYNPFFMNIYDVIRLLT